LASQSFHRAFTDKQIEAGHVVSPYFASLPNRRPHRADNVSRVELFGRNVWSELNHYLLLVTVDIGDPGIQKELSSKLPEGSKVSVVGAFESLQEWSRSNHRPL